MSDPNDLLRWKALGTIQAIEKMSDQERGQHPTGSFAGDYNELRKHVIQHNPGFADLMPPEAESYESAGYGVLTRQTFGELHTYCSQIYHMLASRDTQDA